MNSPFEDKESVMRAALKYTILGVISVGFLIPSGGDAVPLSTPEPSHDALSCAEATKRDHADLCNPIHPHIGPQSSNPEVLENLDRLLCDRKPFRPNQCSNACVACCESYAETEGFYDSLRSSETCECLANAATSLGAGAVGECLASTANIMLREYGAYGEFEEEVYALVDFVLDVTSTTGAARQALRNFMDLNMARTAFALPHVRAWLESIPSLAGRLDAYAPVIDLAIPLLRELSSVLASTVQLCELATAPFSPGFVEAAQDDCRNHCKAMKRALIINQSNQQTVCGNRPTPPQRVRETGGCGEDEDTSGSQKHWSGFVGATIGGILDELTFEDSVSAGNNSPPRPLGLLPPGGLVIPPLGPSCVGPCCGESGGGGGGGGGPMQPTCWVAGVQVDCSMLVH